MLMMKNEKKTDKIFLKEQPLRWKRAPRRFAITARHQAPRVGCTAPKPVTGSGHLTQRPMARTIQMATPMLRRLAVMML